MFVLDKSDIAHLEGQRLGKRCSLGCNLGVAVENLLKVESQIDLMDFVAVVAQPLQPFFGVLTRLFFRVLSFTTKPFFVELENLIEHNLLLLRCFGALKHLSTLDYVVDEHLIKNCHLLCLLEIFLGLALINVRLVEHLR